MIKITQLKLPIKHTEDDMIGAISKALKLPPQRIKDVTIIKKSIDARKNDIKFIYSVEVTVILEAKESETTIVARSKNENASIAEKAQYDFTPSGTKKLTHRPVVVGTGPAGLFTAWLLAKHGYQPLVVERGYEVSKRVEAVEHFWKSNELNPECNVQFGEGGAGTFSDGKLNTLVKDAFNRYHLVMETFFHHGAPSDILYLNKPHIGTDMLRYVVENMRKEMIAFGAEVRFGTKLTDLIIEDGKLCGIELNHKEKLPCKVLIPAIGHSARDTFSMFLKRGLELSPKAFAIGLRIEHKQSMISKSQYGSEYIHLPAADYKLTHQTQTGRGVYSFCMCPGGFVVNASSEQGHLAVNGMSNYNRDEENANSAIVVTVQPEDFGGKGPLSGIEFQRNWERAAYDVGKGVVPVQLFGDLLRGRESVTIGNVTPGIKGEYRLANLANCLPDEIMEALKEGILAFDRKIKGFANEEAVLAGVESRTSSPVRIQRNDTLESNIAGIYPCGEGAGYAGGITSAAIDGIKVFEAIAGCYTPAYE
jgi:uncharacterized FAD-dependent dehydrogenase